MFRHVSMHQETVVLSDPEEAVGKPGKLDLLMMSASVRIGRKSSGEVSSTFLKAEAFLEPITVTFLKMTKQPLKISHFSKALTV